MKKVLMGVGAVLLLVGCNPDINYKGKKYKAEQLEDVLEAELTEENPNLSNIDVAITSGEELNVSKKRK